MTCFGDRAQIWTAELTESVEMWTRPVRRFVGGLLPERGISEAQQAALGSSVHVYASSKTLVLCPFVPHRRGYLIGSGLLLSVSLPVDAAALGVVVVDALELSASRSAIENDSFDDELAALLDLPPRAILNRRIKLVSVHREPSSAEIRFRPMRPEGGGWTSIRTDEPMLAKVSDQTRVGSMLQRAISESTGGTH